MVIEKVLLKDIVNSYPAELIYNWDFIDIDYSTRIYIKPVDVEEKSGFYFYVANMTSHINNREWDINETEVECLYHGTAYFDGIRHLYMGIPQTDTEGYLYYPELDTSIKVFQALQELEKKYCAKD